MTEWLKRISESLTIEECQIIRDTLMALKGMIKKGGITDINVLVKDINDIINVINLAQIYIYIMQNEKKKKDKDSD